MDELKNSVLLKYVLKALYNVASRRTSAKTADETIGSSIKTLERKFDFLRYVDINQVDFTEDGYTVSVSPDIDEVPPSHFGAAVEALIRVVYNDLSSDAGLYFVTELKEYAGEDIIRHMQQEFNVDFDQIQLEQHYAYRRMERKKQIAEAVKTGRIDKRRPQNLLGYTWGNVAYWKHEPGSKFCTLYDKQGRVLDRLNLDRIIQNYVEKLSGYTEVDLKEIEKEIVVYEKEYQLLKLLLERDMDAETAMHKLKITRDELNNMIQKLAQMEMLHYVSFDTLELTETGISYISKKQENR
ncbi:MAG: hypothetical protein FE039_02150 [Thermoplasmata archaeon]|nr:MAG: hypothetical protein FE039_02150 [Thermoplasmata archaeon]